MDQDLNKVRACAIEARNLMDYILKQIPSRPRSDIPYSYQDSTTTGFVSNIGTDQYRKCMTRPEKQPAQKR